MQTSKNYVCECGREKLFGNPACWLCMSGEIMDHKHQDRCRQATTESCTCSDKLNHNKESIRVRYDGPALAEHSIDVNHLAPALLALGDLWTLANRKFNKERASVKVSVQANVEEKCFDFGIEIVQTIYEQVKSLLKEDEIKTAKDIAEWLGLIGGSAWGFLKLVAWVNGREITSQKVVKKAGRDVIEINVDGENNSIQIYPETLDLYKEPKAIKNAQNIVRPLAEEGYETLEFEHGKEPLEKINKEEASKILSIDADAIEEIEHEEEPQIATYWIKVYSPVYDEKATKWHFELTGWFTWKPS